MNAADEDIVLASLTVPAGILSDHHVVMEYDPESGKWTLRLVEDTE